MNHGKRLTAAIVAIIAALALMSAWLLASNPPADESIPAAIVNLDEPATIDGQVAPMGRQFAAELVRNPGPFAWEVTNAQQAETGLRDGTYQAVVTIPATFSTAVTSIQDPAKATVGTVDVEVRPGSTVGEESLTKVVVDAAGASIGKQLTENFIGQTLGGFKDLQSGLGGAAAGAEQLATGSKDAASGLSQLSEGIAQFGDGVTQAADGAAQGAAGAEQLATGANQGAGGVAELAGGAEQLSDASGALADGLGQLAAATQTITDQSAGMDQQLKTLGKSVTDYTDGVAQVGETLRPAQDGLPTFGEQLGAAVEAIGTTLATDSPDVLINAGQLATNLGAYTAQVCGADPASEACQTLSPLAQQAGTLATDANGLLGLEGTLPAEVGALQPLLADQMPPLIESAVTAGHLVNEGTPDPPGLAVAGTQLAAGINDGLQEIPLLLKGIAGINQGLQASADGSRQLATGQADFAAGAGQAADGVEQLADGASQLADGNAQLAEGLSQAAAGAAPLTEGTEQAATGMKQLSGGVADLADGLTTAVDQIPSFKTSDVDKMGEVLAGPVEVSATGVGKDAAGPSAAALILWLTTFFLALAYRPFSPHVVSSTRSASLLAFSAWWRPALFAGAIGALTGGVLSYWSQADGAGTTGLIVAGAIIGLAFVTIQQALNAAFGIFGRLVSLVILIACSIPGSVSEWMPPGGAAALFSGLAIPGLPAGGTGLLTVIIWGLVAFAVTIWATSSKRKHPNAAPAIQGVN